MDAVKKLAKEVADTAKALARGSSGQFCATIVVVPIEVDGISTPSYAIGIDPASVAVRGESVRINDDGLKSNTLRVQFRNFIRSELEPVIEGVGQFRVLWGEAFDGVVVIAAVPDDNFGKRHDSVPLRNSAGGGKT